MAGTTVLGRLTRLLAPRVSGKDSTENIAWRFWTMLLGALKSGIAEIATTNSSRQFGREEEKE
jgi:hypothetical protein